MVDRKTEIDPIDGTPEKRVFLSIIADYDLKTGLCELVDNALDLWVQRGRRGSLRINIILDAERQLISVGDNAGGVREQDLHYLISPGGSRNDPSAEVIGIFGVGSKRASIALGERVEIRTRYARERSFQLDITPEWLQSTDWYLPAYEIPDLTAGTTQVDISHLRKPFSGEHIDGIRSHLGETYEWFVREGCVIAVNGAVVTPLSFENWSFPPDFPPRRATFERFLTEDEKVSCEITAGLIRDRDPELENYGAYFYCNHRMIVKELRTRDVGYFVTSEAGVPHPDASLCRTIVHLQGPARLMPWNSSKNGINVDHPAFRSVRPTLISLISHFSSLSRRLKDDWDGKVFRFDTGNVENIEPQGVSPGGRLHLPALPRVRKHYAENLKTRNRAQIQSQPWTLGLVEALAAVMVIQRQRLETKNRIALILLDSNFEIALKEFIVHRQDLFPLPQFNNAYIQQLFNNRPNVIAATIGAITIPPALITKANHYYNLRNKLIHERATVDITDSDVENYKDTVEKILRILFNLRFSPE